MLSLASNISPIEQFIWIGTKFGLYFRTVYVYDLIININYTKHIY